MRYTIECHSARFEIDIGIRSIAIRHAVVIDAHIHIQPFDMMKPDVQRTFWQRRTTAPSSRRSPRIRRSCSRQMDADGIERVGLINYVSPDVMGFTARGATTGWCATRPPTRRG